MLLAQGQRLCNSKTRDQKLGEQASPKQRRRTSAGSATLGTAASVAAPASWKGCSTAAAWEERLGSLPAALLPAIRLGWLGWLRAAGQA